MKMLHRWSVAAVALTATMAWADDVPKAAKDDNAADRAGMVYVSEMLDAHLINEAGDNIGDIEDTIFTADGRIHYLIVGEGGILGIGETYLAVPFRNVEVNIMSDNDSRKLAVTMKGGTVANLEQAPRLASSTYRELKEPAWRQSNADYFKAEVPKLTEPSDLLLSSQITGASVYNNDKKELADIDYLVVDATKGVCRYVLIDHETTVTDNELVVVPFPVLNWQFPSDGKLFARLNATTEQLNRSPRIAINNIGRFADKAFLENVDRAFPAMSAKAN